MYLVIVLRLRSRYRDRTRSAGPIPTQPVGADAEAVQRAAHLTLERRAHVAATPAAAFRWAQGIKSKDIPVGACLRRQHSHSTIPHALAHRYSKPDDGGAPVLVGNASRVRCDTLEESFHMAKNGHEDGVRWWKDSNLV